jgi:hypothetical protein
MRGKLLFITGGLVGYVLGARAGRKRYDQIAAAASELWHAKPVQRRVTEVRDFALDAVGDAPAALFEAGKKAYATLQGKQARARGSAAQGSAAQGTAEDAEASAPHASAARTAAAVKVANSPVSKAPGSKAAKPASSKPASKPAAKSAAPDAAGETTTK